MAGAISLPIVIQPLLMRNLFLIGVTGKERRNGFYPRLNAQIIKLTVDVHGEVIV